MDYKVKADFITQLKSDIDKKYLSGGIKLGGEIKENKIKLYTTDDRGKHSSFAARTFYGRVEGEVLSGKFSVSYYVLILFAILTAVCIESIVAAIISGSLFSIAFPIVIIALEVLYLVFIKRISAENDVLINKYLEGCKVED